MRVLIFLLFIFCSCASYYDSLEEIEEISAYDAQQVVSGIEDCKKLGYSSYKIREKYEVIYTVLCTGKKFTPAKEVFEEIE